MAFIYVNYLQNLNLKLTKNSIQHAKLWFDSTYSERVKACFSLLGVTDDLKVALKCLQIFTCPPVAGPPLAGVMVDHTHSLRLPLVISAVVQGAASIMAGVTCVVNTVNKKQKKGYLNML